MEWGVLGIGILAMAAEMVLGRRARRWWTRLLVLLLVLPAIIVIVSGSVLVWYYHRPLPSETSDVLFEGVTYMREVRSEPRPLVLHVVTVALDTPGLEFLVTPSEPYQGRQLGARTTSQFLTEFDVQLAINGSFFEPWWTNGLWDYYPHVGDPVDVYGFASSRGDVYSPANTNFSTIYFSAENEVSINQPPAEPYNALSGNQLLLLDGTILDYLHDLSIDDLHPRTAMGFNEAANSLVIVVVDGRQPNYSEGVTLVELANIFLEYGVTDAVNLDGGGSSTLVIEGTDGKPFLLNSPIDNRIPGRERPVANHLGIYVHP